LGKLPNSVSAEKRERGGKGDKEERNKEKGEGKGKSEEERDREKVRVWERRERDLFSFEGSWPNKLLFFLHMQNKGLTREQWFSTFGSLVFIIQHR